MYFQETVRSSRFEGHDIDHSYNLFVQIILLAVDTYIPKLTKQNLLDGPRNYQSLYVTKNTIQQVNWLSMSTNYN